ncbi:MAG TPA: DUF305 domain-containing protein [Mycobacterium sp.]|uniref:DUF305 domain-containing protein n=1 Tax=Mycolicibacterium sp. TaxID=2320850 RepID=UPI0025FEDACD|nr:DUF305 domain-containing protein [Mycolicibacterium sp.]HPX36661.1 DUF305 domain-containing protein [Mycobacterium sp.]HQC76387.1 DUF305 domain-containing protein [Mycobacterium sp.]
MTALHIRAAALLAASATAVVLSSCSAATKTATEEHGSHSSSASQSDAHNEDAHNEDDVLFAQLMIPHHEQAVTLAAMVPDRSANPEVRALAEKIASAQQPEITTMKDQLKRWGINPAEMPHESGHAGMSMQGMVGDDTLVKLEGLKGADFDTLWLQSMIGHHQGAIEMAKVEAKAGKSPEMMTLARSIISAQQAEIDQMKQMLAANGG